MIYIKRLFFKLLGKTPAHMPMVQYWKRSDAVQAKVMRQNGTLVMQMAGEKHVFPGFPRGYLLFGKLSKLKHGLKNQIFNDSWALLEKGMSAEQVIKRAKFEVMPQLYELFEESRYDIVPKERMVPAVREVYEAWDRAGGSPKLRDLVTYILQEDDSYRFRFQWMIPYMRPSLMGLVDPVRCLERGFVWMENAEIIGDMKERVRLVRRILLCLLQDPENREFWRRFCHEARWSKIKLTTADKFFFRGKYFKVDFDKFDY